MQTKPLPKESSDDGKITTLDRKMVASRVRQLGGDKKAARTSILYWRSDIDEKALDKVLDSLDDSEIS